MKRNRMLTLTALLACSCLFPGTSKLKAQQFEISWHTIDGGGGYSSAGNFEMEGTIGQHDAGPVMSGGVFSISGGFWTGNANNTILLGDVNQDGVVDLLDVAPFVDAITNGIFIAEADVNQDGQVDLLDVNPFVQLLIS